MWGSARRAVQHACSAGRVNMPTHTVTANQWLEQSPRNPIRDHERPYRRVRARAPLQGLAWRARVPTFPPYCDTYGGLVLNATIDRYCYATLESTFDGTIEFRAPDIGCIDTMGRDLGADQTPLDLHRAIYERVTRDFDLGQPAIRLTTISDAPPDRASVPLRPWWFPPSRPFANSSACRSVSTTSRVLPSRSNARTTPGRRQPGRSMPPHLGAST